MRARWWGVLGVTAVLVAGACSDDDAIGGDAAAVGVETSSDTGVDDPPVGDTASPDGDDGFPTIEVIDAGAQPRVELRLAPEEGSEQLVTQVTEVEQQFVLDGRRQSLGTPPLVFDLRYVVDRVDGDQIFVTAVYDAVDVKVDAGDDPVVGAQLEELTDLLVGQPSGVQWDTRGRLIAADIDVGTITDALDPVSAAALEQVFVGFEEQLRATSTPFPLEAVGVGATWLVTAESTLGGFPATVTSEIVVTAIDGDLVETTIEQVIEYQPGPVELGGPTAEIIDGRITSSGTARTDLSGVVSLQESTGAGAVRLAFESDGQRVDAELLQTQTFSVSPR